MYSTYENRLRTYFLVQYLISGFSLYVWNKAYCGKKIISPHILLPEKEQKQKQKTQNHADMHRQHWHCWSQRQPKIRCCLQQQPHKHDLRQLCPVFPFVVRGRRSLVQLIQHSSGLQSHVHSRIFSVLAQIFYLPQQPCLNDHPSYLPWCSLNLMAPPIWSLTGDSKVNPMHTWFGKIQALTLSSHLELDIQNPQSFSSLWCWFPESASFTPIPPAVDFRTLFPSLSLCACPRGSKLKVPIISCRWLWGSQSGCL